MQFIMNEGFQPAEETVSMLFQYANGISFNELYERLLKTQRIHLTELQLEEFACEFTHLEAIKNDLCAEIDSNDPLLSFYFKNISLSEQDPFCLADILFEVLHYSAPCTCYERIAIMKQQWQQHIANGYVFISDGELWSIKPALPSDDPNYLLKQVNALPYSKEVCVNLYLVFSDFDRYMDELYAMLHRFDERLISRLSEPDNLRSSLLDQWKNYLKLISIDDYLINTAGIKSKYDSERMVQINFSSMRPNKILYDRIAEDVPPDQNYFITIGIGVLPEFKLYSDSRDPDRMFEMLHLMGDKTKFEILLRLKDRPYYCLELAQEIGLNPGHMSRSLTSLFYAGLVNLNRQGSKVFYSINKSCMMLLINSIEDVFVRE